MDQPYSSDFIVTSIADMEKEFADNNSHNPMWKKAMWQSSCEPVTAVLILVALVVLTNSTASVILCVNDRTASISLGALILLIAIILVIRHITWSSDLKARGVYIATALFVFLSARSLFSESERFLVTASQPNLAVL
jgi:hypothetical protein